MQIVSQIDKKHRKFNIFSVSDRSISDQICDAVFMERMMSWK